MQSLAAHDRLSFQRRSKEQLMRLHLPLLLLCLASFCSAAEGEPRTALLPNGSLEADANADQWPDGWARPKSGAQWVEEAGNHFLRLASSQPAHSA